VRKLEPGDCFADWALTAMDAPQPSTVVVPISLRTASLDQASTNHIHMHIPYIQAQTVHTRTNRTHKHKPHTQAQTLKPLSTAPWWTHQPARGLPGSGKLKLYKQAQTVYTSTFCVHKHNPYTQAQTTNRVYKLVSVVVPISLRTASLNQTSTNRIHTHVLFTQAQTTKCIHKHKPYSIKP
jgi:hypothetical protein